MSFQSDSGIHFKCMSQEKRFLLAETILAREGSGGVIPPLPRSNFLPPFLSRTSAVSPQRIYRWHSEAAQVPSTEYQLLSVTVTVVVPMTPLDLLPHLPVMVAMPAATAVTVAEPPVLSSVVAVAPSTVATAESLVSQYTK